MLRKSLIGLMALGFVCVSSQAFAQAECKTAYGQTACGYDCKAAYGQIACARTPQGVCEAAYGQVVCWDPDRRVHQKATCLAAHGQIACGYDCKSASGMVKCADTPQGACAAAYGQLVCWDPGGRSRQKAMCLAAHGQIACGYDCKSAYGTVKCARTAEGVCKAANGNIVCFN